MKKDHALKSYAQKYEKKTKNSGKPNRKSYPQNVDNVEK